MNQQKLLIAFLSLLVHTLSAEIPPAISDKGRFLTSTEFEAYLTHKEDELINRLKKIDEDCEIQYPFLEFTGEDKVFSHDYLPNKKYNEKSCSYAVSFLKPSTWKILKERMSYEREIFVFETPHESMTFIEIDGEFKPWIISGGSISTMTFPEMKEKVNQSVDTTAISAPR